jgi:putative endonuclease
VLLFNEVVDFGNRNIVDKKTVFIYKMLFKMFPGSSVGSLPAWSELSQGADARVGQGAGSKFMYYVCVIQSQVDGKLYKGFTSDLGKRMKAHNRGEVKSTRRRRPFKLIHQEEYQSKSEALEREKFLKSFEGGKALKNILQCVPR